MQAVKKGSFFFVHSTHNTHAHNTPTFGGTVMQEAPFELVSRRTLLSPTLMVLKKKEKEKIKLGDEEC